MKFPTFSIAMLLVPFFVTASCITPDNGPSPPAPDLAYCEDNGSIYQLADRLGGLGSLKTSCKVKPLNAWTFLGKDVDQRATEHDRAGLVARSDLDYCLLRTTDKRAQDISRNVRFLGRFGAGQDIYILAKDPSEDNRFIGGVRDLYVYLFGIKYHLQRQDFEARFPRQGYPDVIKADISVRDPRTGDAVGMRVVDVTIANHSTYLQATALRGNKSTTLSFPLYAGLSLKLIDVQAQGIVKDSGTARVWDWYTYPAFFDRLDDVNRKDSALLAYHLATFPPKSVEDWGTYIRDVHWDFGKAAWNGRGVVSEITWTNSETFAAGGEASASVGTLVAIFTGGTIPGWLDDLLSLLSIKMGAGLDFIPGSTLQVENSLVTPQFVSNPDFQDVEDHARVKMNTSFSIEPWVYFKFTLNLVFWSDTWTWDYSPGDWDENEKFLVSEAQVTLYSKEQSSGRSAHYDFIKLYEPNGSSDDFMGRAADVWIKECLASPKSRIAPPPPRPPEVTTDVPHMPQLCVVEATCEGTSVFFEMCVCEDENTVYREPGDCIDSFDVPQNWQDQLNLELNYPCK